jgi:uncharacterized RDD family membrane protein YckC
MSDAVRFETPENIELSFTMAGLGTRFMAWFADNVLMIISMIILFILLALGGIVTDSLLTSVEDGFANAEDGPQATVYLIGLFIMVWGLGSFFYFGIFELFMRGQTPGKRMSRIRVVKSDGFSLDAVSILVRNIFRVLDHIPVLWIVPLASSSGLRFGDMVAGTIVIQDEVTTLATVREELTSRPAAEAQFRFTPTMLKELRPSDVAAVEQLLERWQDLAVARRNELRNLIVEGLTKRLEIDAPNERDRLRFLEDLLAAEYRRQVRRLG